MVNTDNKPIFIESILKVHASEDLDVQADLDSNNEANKSISKLLEDNEKTEKEEK